VRLEAVGPISVTCKSGSLTGLSQGIRKRVSLVWPKLSEGRPRLWVDGEEYPAAYEAIWGGSSDALREGPGCAQHLLVFTLPAGEHRFEIRS